MIPNNLTQFYAWFFGLILFSGVSNYLIADSYSLDKQSYQSHAEIISELTQANIIYLGETHDSLADHQAQLAIIQSLYQKKPKIAIALEMFQRPYQKILDQYIAGEITETDLKEQTEYEERWGFDWEYYAPIFRFAKTHNLPLLALNTPTEITYKVARQGLEKLSPQELQYIPPLAEIRTDNQAYRQILQEIYQSHLQEGQGNSQDFERFFTAQVLWDETMADAIAKFFQANSQSQIIVLAGKGHIIYGYGIPSRVKRRLKGLSFIQRSVLMGESQEDIQQREETPASDYFWQHQVSK